MTGQPGGSAHTDFALVIRACCGNAPDSQIQEFRATWHEFLRADLSQFTSSAAEMRSASEAAWPEYRSKLSAAYNSEFDYALYFRAVAYAHLSHLKNDKGMQKLFAKIPPRGLFQSVDHDCYVLVFVTLLKMDHECAGYLLDLSFDLVSLAADRMGCLQGLLNLFREKGWLL
jgi:hypothetical protein